MLFSSMKGCILDFFMEPLFSSEHMVLRITKKYNRRNYSIVLDSFGADTVSICAVSTFITVGVFFFFLFIFLSLYFHSKNISSISIIDLFLNPIQNSCRQTFKINSTKLNSSARDKIPWNADINFPRKERASRSSLQFCCSNEVDFIE